MKKLCDLIAPTMDSLIENAGGRRVLKKLVSQYKYLQSLCSPEILNTLVSLRLKSDRVNIACFKFGTNISIFVNMISMAT